jgi:hypothetical protein
MPSRGVDIRGKGAFILSDDFLTFKSKDRESRS